MSANRAPTAAWRPHRASRDDAGFTLLEVITAAAVIGVVMAGLGAFFVRAIGTARQQGDLQTAVQLATSRMEEFQAMDPSAIVTGADNQTIAGTDFTRRWESEACWQQTNPLNADVADCQPAPGLGAWAELVRVVVTVTWTDPTCRPGPCSYGSTTMISRAPTEPIFNNRAP